VLCPWLGQRPCSPGIGCHPDGDPRARGCDGNAACSLADKHTQSDCRADAYCPQYPAAADRDPGTNANAVHAADRRADRDTDDAYRDAICRARTDAARQSDAHAFCHGDAHCADANARTDSDGNPAAGHNRAGNGDASAGRYAHTVGR
jgi:hypothetical protein